VNRAAIACALVLAACGGSNKSGTTVGGGTVTRPAAPTATATAAPATPAVADGELKLILGPNPDDTITVQPDGDFDIVIGARTSMRACDGECPRRVESFAIRGETVVQGKRELLTRAADGTVDFGGMGRVTIDEDGAFVQDGQRHAIDANGRIAGGGGQPDVMVVGATTPALRRRAILVLAFVSLLVATSAIDEASH